MSGKGALIFNGIDVTGYLVVNGVHYEIVGKRMSDIRTHLQATKTFEEQFVQQDFFDERPSTSGQRKCDSP
jgi:hypothetical protein